MSVAYPIWPPSYGAFNYLSVYVKQVGNQPDSITQSVPVQEIRRLSETVDQVGGARAYRFEHQAYAGSTRKISTLTDDTGEVFAGRLSINLAPCGPRATAPQNQYLTAQISSHACETANVFSDYSPAVSIVQPQLGRDDLVDRSNGYPIAGAFAKNTGRGPAQQLLSG